MEVSYVEAGSDVGGTDLIDAEVRCIAWGNAAEVRRD